MRALADFFYTLSWRVPGRTWRRLYAFAEAEAESALELRCAAAQTSDAELAAKFLRHAEDEARHARILLRRAEVARGRGPLAPPRMAHAHLYRALGEDAFIAFVLRGETRGRRQFEAHVRYFEERDPALSTALASILADERQHESYTRTLLAERSDAPSLRRGVAWRDRAYRWRRAGTLLTAPLFALTMGVLYLLSAPLALMTKRPRPGWREGE
ncbi:MAG: ferritin-like domain-containing protein [Polyangiales bacterium]